MEQEIAEGFRLSPRQRHLWRARSAAPQGGFGVRGLVRLEGELDAGRLQAALAALAADQEILRTTFGHLPGIALPVQVIGEELAPRFERIEGDSAAAVRRFESLGAASFDLERGPIVHATLVAGAAGVHWLVLGLPAMSCDASGLESLVAALLETYAGRGPAAGAGTESDDEAEAPLQYADLSEWQNELLDADEAAAELDAWVQRGATARPGFDLAFLPRTDSASAASFRPAAVEVPISDELRARTAELAARTGTTVERIHLAAWLALLARHSGQTELLLGWGCDGRTHEELHGALGLFAHDLPLACEVSPQTPFAELVAGLGAPLAEARGHQEYFSWEHLGGGEQGSFPVSFAAELRATIAAADAPRAVFERLWAHTERFRLRLVSIGDGRLELHFDAAACETAEAVVLARRLAALLADAVAAPQQAVGDLRLLAEGETVAGLAGAVREFPRDACIHELIAAAAAADPAAACAIDAAGTLTYGELELRSNQLANHLAAAGVGPEVRVGLCLERSSRMLVAMLGVLKAGGAYVPIDPAYPEDRRAFVIRDARVPVLLTEGELVAAGEEFGGARVIRLDAEWEAIAAAGDEAPAAGVGPRNLAYVIYTSGSTGTPKGVEIEHRNLVHSTTARYAYYSRDPRRYLLLSSFAFDSSVAGIFWTLTRGGALVLPASGEEKEVARLGELIAGQGVTTMLALPSLYGLLLDHVDPQALSSLECVVVAGEACPRDLPARHRAKLPDAELHNEYGPTEATVWCTATACNEVDAAGPVPPPVPIGAPIPNTRVWLLDAHGRPVPRGVPGELYVGGAGVARGYLDRPELTAERFVPDALSGVDGARLYRTGDLARALPDGRIEFLGRIDDQVKVRGYRIELGEIEDAIAAAPGVREAVVVARPDAAGDTRLVAYVVGPSTTDGIAAGLRERLPEYMVPGAIVALDELPRTPNGKVDRRALPEPDGGRPAVSTEYVAPAGPLETAVSQVWAEVLGIAQVGVEDNFFELGGHSIMAVRLLARMNEALQVDVHLRTLFDAPTVRGLLALLGRDAEQAERLARTAELLARISQLSEEQVDSALEERGGS